MNRHKAAVDYDEGQQTKKQQEVLNVASDYFLSHGYTGTSINAMARESGISKESIYRYFSSKKELFEAVIFKELRDYRKRLDFLNVEYETMPIDAALQKIGESILQAVTNDRVLALRRLVFHEAVQSPELGQLYYEIGPRAAYEYLVKMFSAHQDEFAIDATRLAHDFVALVLHRIMLERECAVIETPKRGKIREHASEVTRHFLNLYSTEPRVD